MYLMWAEKNGYAVELIDRQDNEEAGINHASIAIRGPMAYGYLKGETGMHRLVRISPFNSEGKRQTSFAAVDVSPEIADSVAVEIDPQRHPRGHVPRQRRRRPARQQDLERHPPHALSHRHRRAVPERAQPAQEPRHRLEDAARPHGPHRRRKTRSRRSGQVPAAGEDRLRLADSQLLPAPRPARERRPHEVRPGQLPRRDGRRHPGLSRRRAPLARRASPSKRTTTSWFRTHPEMARRVY